VHVLCAGFVRVVEDDVRMPEIFSRNVQHVDISVLLWIPR
jgi:hypothetical protein